MNYIYTYKTPIGDLNIAANEQAITHVFLGETRNVSARIEQTELIKKAARQIEEYFAGQRTEFELELFLQGTEFQKRVWNSLKSIPYGQTRSYKQIAQIIGNEKASRAVGNANNKNPIMIIIPCHRVVGSNGSLVGYAGGLDIKQKLLELENVKI